MNGDEQWNANVSCAPEDIGLDATVQIHPVMTAEDLERATPAIEQAAQRYG